MLAKKTGEDGVVLKTINLRKDYVTGKEIYSALKGVSLIIKRGELVSVVGPSGSGKSTLLNLLGALDRPTSGKVYIDGVDIYRLSDKDLAELRNRKIGFVFQAFNLIPRLTAIDNVQLPLLIRKIDPDERRRRAINLLTAVGLGSKINRKPNELSGGEQQRVAIARALVTNPSIILGDEITGNLDSKTTQEIVKLVQDLNKKFNTTFIIVTHNMEVANQTHRIIRLRDGTVEKDISLEKTIY
ncbi:MAG: ABC transporter ATP-binding protein [Nitrososphaerales archaeon]